MSARLEVRSARLGGGWRDARRSFERREAILLTLEDDRGRTGVGEAAPLPGFSSDTPDTCRDALEAFVRALPLEVGLEDVGRVAPPAARFAVETALLALGETPAHVLLGGRLDAPAPRLAAVVEDVEAARAAVARGCAAVKVKAGRVGLEEEMARVRQVHAVLPAGVRLRVDANGCLPERDVTDWMAALARLDPEYVEEPIADPRRLVAVPCAIALDESLGWLEAGEIAALADRARVLVLKPAYLGGALRCLELARLAGSLGLEVTVSHLLDGPVGLAAAVALARALPRPPLACGLEATWA